MVSVLTKADLPFDLLPSFADVVGRPFSELTSSLAKGSEIFGPGDLEPPDLDILTEGSIDAAVIAINYLPCERTGSNCMSPYCECRCLKGI